MRELKPHLSAGEMLHESLVVVGGGCGKWVESGVQVK